MAVTRRAGGGTRGRSTRTWSRLSASFPGGGRSADLDVWQFWLGLLIVVISVATIRPLSTHGRGLILLVLLVVNCALLLQRALPERIVSERSRLGLLTVGALTSAAMLGLAPAGVATVFPYFVAGHAGFRLPTRRAFGIAALTTLSCVVALLIAGASGNDSIGWYFGLFVGLPVFIGASNRSHREAMQAANELADQVRRTADAEAEAKALAERGRIARDVHDVLAHSLAAINMQLEVADAMLDAERPVEARAATQRAQSLVRDGLAEVRRTVSDLREDVLPLEESVRRLVASAGGKTEDVRVTGPVRPLATEVSQTLVRCVQESVTNARRHAPAAVVGVALSYDQAAVAVEVRNGPATATDRLRSPGSGLGLVGMRERVALVGGRLLIGPITQGPDAGGGRVHIEVPT